jgi:uncharacterized membrane protein YuzA (DUF378 family)
MQPEIGRLAVTNTAGVGSIAVLQRPPDYVNWFDVVHEISGFMYTYGDLADVISAIVGICVIYSTIKTIVRERKK